MAVAVAAASASPARVACRWAAQLAAVVSLGFLAAASIASAQGARPDLDEAARRITAQSNVFRAASNRPELVANERLTATAAAFARYMARTDRYGHEADGRAPAERVTAAGYDYCVVLENIAFIQSSAGFSTAELARRLATGWEESPGHRRNLLDPDVTQIGVALAQSEKTRRFYAVQIFGRPKAAALSFSIANESAASVGYRLGDKAFDLSPGMTRTHEQCRIERLALPASAEPRGARIDGELSGGERFVIRGEGPGTLRVERR